MPANMTPMMRQYLELKEKYSDCLLFFRLGDFYEMFFEDAVTASKELEIVLTGRDCGLDDRAPMCGVPYHSVNSYIVKLIDKGYKVAICEQLTDPAEAKGLVERDVVRVITPGTVIEESMLSERKNNYIVGIFAAADGAGLAYCDVSTGGFHILQIDGTGWPDILTDELARIGPTEIIANDALFMQEALDKRLRSMYYLEPHPSASFDFASAKTRLESHFGPGSLKRSGGEGLQLAVSAAGALIEYLSSTQKNGLTHINDINVYTRSSFMSIDASTRRNLELTQPLRFDGGKKNTLLSLLDGTCTAMGGRMLRAWIDEPLQSVDAINLRLDAVEELASKHIERAALRKALSSIYDIERLCSRIAYGTVNPRDCDALRSSLSHIPEALSAVTHLNAAEYGRIASELDEMEDISGLLYAAITEEPPVSVKDGDIIREGYDKEVDSYRSASDNGRNWLAQLEAKERAETGIKNLRVGYNRVTGYYIEVSKANQHLVPYTYERRQTLANSERYITAELRELEGTILGAEEKRIQREYKLFIEIREILLGAIERLQHDARLIATLDAYAALAEAAFANSYCRPKMVRNGTLDIREGRHPVVERAIKDGFIPNDTLLDSKTNRLLILTGPNMAGKSTYMRQVALITLMAHIGSFVPAQSAQIPITDKIFTRVGASDNLASGQSTFMVEMSEMANILKNASSQSLLIIDEIGRGTSTFDGLSIAWAVLEYIADEKRCGAKTLFATHYHELTELEGKLPGIINYRISVKEVGEDIIFLRRIVRGGADKSFGVQVARLAGLPDDVISRAKEILAQLETADINRELLFQKPDPEITRQLSIFDSGISDDIITELTKLDVNKLTPMDALTKLYELHLRAAGR